MSPNFIERALGWLEDAADWAGRQCLAVARWAQATADRLYADRAVRRLKGKQRR